MKDMTLDTWLQEKSAEYRALLADEPEADEERANELMDEAMEDAAPSMTTTLFRMASMDNRLAFVELEREHSNAFDALYEAVERKVSDTLCDIRDAFLEEQAEFLSDPTNTTR